MKIYEQLFLRHPLRTLCLLLFLSCVAVYYLRDFRLDSDIDSLILANDKDLVLYREITALYQTKNFLIIQYTPDANLFSKPVLKTLLALREDLK